MRVRLLIVALFIITIILLIIALFSSKKSIQQIAPLPTPTPVLPGSSQHNATSSALFGSDGKTISINGVIMDNFYKTSTPFNPQGDRILDSTNDNYRIFFISSSNEFLLTITGSGFAQNRAAAEQAFLQALNLSPENACKLHVVVQTISSVNSQEAGQDYPLSFCASQPALSAAKSPTPIFYQTKNSLDIAVGNVIVGSGALVGVARVITSNLSRSGGTLFDQFAGHPRGVPGIMTLPPAIQQLYPSYRVVLRGGSNIGPAWRYWCTDLIIDTYNLKLGKRVLGEDLGAVQSQVSFWKRKGGSFVYMRYINNHARALQALFQTAPNFGDAIFWESQEGTYNGGEHVGLIRGGTVDSHGNGEIDTYEANAGRTSGKYPITNWQIKNVPFPVVGFGLYTGE